MTQKQRLFFSLLIAVAVLLVMLGLTWLQTRNLITEQTFKYLAVAAAVVVVVLNGILRRKVRR